MDKQVFIFPWEFALEIVRVKKQPYIPHRTNKLYMKFVQVKSM